MSERNFDAGSRRERVVLRFDSIEEAVAFVRSFWQAMPHAEMLILPDEHDTDGWSEELTAWQGPHFLDTFLKERAL